MIIEWLDRADGSVESDRAILRRSGTLFFWRWYETEVYHDGGFWRYAANGEALSFSDSQEFHLEREEMRNPKRRAKAWRRIPAPGSLPEARLLSPGPAQPGGALGRFLDAYGEYLEGRRDYGSLDPFISDLKM